MNWRQWQPHLVSQEQWNRSNLALERADRRMLVPVARGRYGGRPVKRRKTTWVPRYGAIQLAQAPRAGTARISGNYGKYDKGSSAAPELKFMDTVINDAIIVTAGALRPTATSDFNTPAVPVTATGTLLQIVQGDQAYQRNGKNIVIKSINARLHVALKGGSDEGDTTDIYRILLIQDTQANGAAPAVTDVISYPGQTLSADSFNNLENNRRFRTLMDVYRPISVPSGGYGATPAAPGEVFHVIKFHKKCNIPIAYSTTATTGALATIKSNNLFFLVISAAAKCQFGGNVRIRYQD